MTTTDTTNDRPSVLVLIGSESDRPRIAPCMDMLDKLGIDGTLRVASAHRTPDLALSLARTARDAGYSVIIAGAGLAAHLPGVLAGATTLPVIGVPLEVGPLNGQDALMSIVQMPKGVPVATVGIGRADNAALLAARMIGIADTTVAATLERHAASMAAQVDPTTVPTHTTTTETTTTTTTATEPVHA